MTYPSDIPFAPMPRLENGMILSASRLNTMIDNVDVLYGLDHQFVTGWLYQLTVARELSSTGPYWSGWVVKRGRILKIGVEAHEDTTWVRFPYVDNNHYVWTGTNHNFIELTINLSAMGLTEWQVYPLRIESERPPRYAYITDDPFSVVAVAPIFANGATSAASHFNGVIEHAEAVADYSAQPIGYGISERPIRNLAGQKEFITFLPIRSPYFEYYGTAYGAPNSSDDSFTWTRGVVNNQGLFNFGAPFVEHHLNYGATFNPSTRQVVTAFTAGEFGSIIPVRFRMDFQEDGGGATVYWYGGAPDNGYGGGITAANLTRWTAGSRVYGDSGGTPKLEDINVALNNLHSRMWWINPVCRDAQTALWDEGNEQRYNDILFSRRVHRWVAYRSISSDGQSNIQYSTRLNNVSGSVNLPNSPNATSYLDLDTTPIRVGMMMKFGECRYAFQIPQKPEGA